MFLPHWVMSGEIFTYLPLMRSDTVANLEELIFFKLLWIKKVEMKKDRNCPAK